MHSVTPYVLACLLTSIPGIPPGIKFEDAYVQLLPIDRTKCPKIYPNVDIRFEVYTDLHPTQSISINIDDDAALSRSGLDFNLPTYFFFHAFFEDSITPTAQFIRQGYIGKHYNMIFLHAPRLLAGPWYLTAVRNTRVVGQYAARLIDYLVTRGLDLNKLNLVGLSLGAHMAGVCGYYIKSGRPARVTGLDPAGPLFGKLPSNLRLDRADGQFVNIIHTDAGVFGYPGIMGHADFWPNGGKNPQPGCKYRDVAQRNPGVIFEKVFCSHWRAYQYYAESISKPESFLAIQCKSWDQFKRRKCNSNNIVPMGFHTPDTARGNYYLETNPNYPFSKS